MSHNTLKGGIGYEGKVTLTLKNNNLVLMSRTYKNSGTAELFNFLGHCLRGDYEAADDLLPTQVMLLYNKDYATTGTMSDKVERASKPVGYSQVPSKTDIDGVVKVTYNFEIPKTMIFEDFNQIALYSKNKNLNNTNNTTDVPSFSAYYFLTGPTGEPEIQDISEWSATSVLLIDWELSISNQNTEKATN